jgi:hypothetical protein
LVTEKKIAACGNSYRPICIVGVAAGCDLSEAALSRRKRLVFGLIVSPSADHSNLLL